MHVCTRPLARGLPYRAMPPHKAKRIFLDLIAALRFLHSTVKVVHHDVKIANILVMEDDSVRVRAFHSAPDLAQLVSMKAVKGPSSESRSLPCALNMPFLPQYRQKYMLEKGKCIIFEQSLRRECPELPPRF